MEAAECEKQQFFLGILPHHRPKGTKGTASAKSETQRGTASAKSVGVGEALSLSLCSLTFHAADTCEANPSEILSTKAGWPLLAHPPPSLLRPHHHHLLDSELRQTLPIPYTLNHTHSELCLVLSFTGCGPQCPSFGTCSTAQPSITGWCPRARGHPC